MTTSVKVFTRTGEGVPTPTDSLLEGFPGDTTIPLVRGVPSAPQTTILKVIDLAKRQISNDSGVLSGTTSPSHLSLFLPESLPLPLLSESSLSPLSLSSAQLFTSPSSPSSASGGAPTSTTSLSAVSETETPPSSTTIPPSVSTSNTKSVSHNKNVILGGVVGGVVGLFVMTTLIMYYLIRRSRRGKKRDLAHVTAFEVSPDKSIEPTSPPKLQVDPHPSAPSPEVLTANLAFISDANVTHPIPSGAGQKVDETLDESSPDTAMPQRDSLVDQPMSHPNPSSPERIQSTLPIISHNHNPNNWNPLLREILNVTQGGNQGPSDPGDPNVPQNIQIFIINQPPNTNGSVANINENGQNRDHYGQYLPHNMNSDTLSLPPSYNE